MTELNEEYQKRKEHLNGLYTKVEELVVAHDQSKIALSQAEDAYWAKASQLTLDYSELTEDVRKAKIWMECKEEWDAWKKADQAAADAFRAFDRAKCERDRYQALELHGW